MLSLPHVALMLNQEVKLKITEIVGTREVTFPCDTGASWSVIHPDDVPDVAKSPDVKLFTRAILIKSFILKCILLGEMPKSTWIIW